MDKIILQQLDFYGYHGLLKEEKKLGQQFLVDVELFTSLKKAGTSDNMHDSIDYSAVYEMVKGIVEGESKNLIEVVAEEIATSLLKEFSQLEACLIKVMKPNPPIPGSYHSVAVEIYRRKN